LQSPLAPKRGVAWKVTLVLIPVVTAAVLFWLRQWQVHALAAAAGFMAGSQTSS
jgi:cytochrome oxidase assembly protein ShyY1